MARYRPPRPQAVPTPQSAKRAAPGPASVPATRAVAAGGDAFDSLPKWSADGELRQRPDGNIVNSDGTVILVRAVENGVVTYRLPNGKIVPADTVAIARGGALDGNEMGAAQPEGVPPDTDGPVAGEPTVNEQQRPRMDKLRAKITQAGGDIVNNTGAPPSIREVEDILVEVNSEQAIRDTLLADPIIAERYSALQDFLNNADKTGPVQPRPAAADNTRAVNRERELLAQSKAPADVGQKRRREIAEKTPGTREALARADEAIAEAKAALKELRDSGASRAEIKAATKNLESLEKRKKRIPQENAPLGAKARNELRSDQDRSSTPGYEEQLQELRDQQDQLLADAEQADMSGDIQAANDLLQRAEALDKNIASVQKNIDKGSKPQPGAAPKQGVAGFADAEGGTRRGVREEVPLSNRDRFGEATATAAGFRPSKQEARTVVPLSPAERLEMAGDAPRYTDVAPEGDYDPVTGTYQFERDEARVAPTASPAEVPQIENTISRLVEQRDAVDADIVRRANAIRRMQGNRPTAEGILSGSQQGIALASALTESRQLGQQIAALRNQLRRIGVEGDEALLSVRDTPESMPLVGEAGVQNLSAARQNNAANRGLPGVIPTSRRLGALSTLLDSRADVATAPPNVRIYPDTGREFLSEQRLGRGMVGIRPARRTTYPVPQDMMFGPEGFYDSPQGLVDRAMAGYPLATDAMRDMMAENIDALMPLYRADPQTATPMRLVETEDGRFAFEPSSPGYDATQAGSAAGDVREGTVSAQPSTSSPAPAETVASRIARLEREIADLQAETPTALPLSSNPTTAGVYDQAIQSYIDEAAAEIASLRKMDPDSPAPTPEPPPETAAQKMRRMQEESVAGTPPPPSDAPPARDAGEGPQAASPGGEGLGIKAMFGNIGKQLGDNLRKAMFDAYASGLDNVSGIREPALAAGRRLGWSTDDFESFKVGLSKYEEALRRSAEALRKYAKANNLSKEKTREIAQYLSSGWMPQQYSPDAPMPSFLQPFDDGVSPDASGSARMPVPPPAAAPQRIYVPPPEGVDVNGGNYSMSNMFTDAAERAGVTRDDPAAYNAFSDEYTQRYRAAQKQLGADMEAAGVDPADVDATWDFTNKFWSEFVESFSGATPQPSPAKAPGGKKTQQSAAAAAVDSPEKQKPPPPADAPEKKTPPNDGSQPPPPGDVPEKKKAQPDVDGKDGVDSPDADPKAKPDGGKGNWVWNGSKWVVGGAGVLVGVPAAYRALTEDAGERADRLTREGLQRAAQGGTGQQGMEDADRQERVLRRLQTRPAYQTAQNPIGYMMY